GQPEQTTASAPGNDASATSAGNGASCPQTTSTSASSCCRAAGEKISSIRRECGATTTDAFPSTGRPPPDICPRDDVQIVREHSARRKRKHAGVHACHQDATGIFPDRKKGRTCAFSPFNRRSGVRIVVSWPESDYLSPISTSS